MTLTSYANWRMSLYSPEMDARPVIIAGMFQGAGLGILMPALARTAFSTLDAALRPEAMVLFNISRLYGSTIGIALVQIFLYQNTQAMHVALAKDITANSAAAAALSVAMLNDLVTRQAAFIGVIGQFKLMMIVLLTVSPLVALLHKPRLISTHIKE